MIKSVFSSEVLKSVVLCTFPNKVVSSRYHKLPFSNTMNNTIRYRLWRTVLNSRLRTPADYISRTAATASLVGPSLLLSSSLPHYDPFHIGADLNCLGSLTRVVSIVNAVTQSLQGRFFLETLVFIFFLQYSFPFNLFVGWNSDLCIQYLLFFRIRDHKIK